MRTNPKDCQHDEVKLLLPNGKFTFVYKCESCESLGIAPKPEYKLDRLHYDDIREECYPVYIKLRG